MNKLNYNSLFCNCGGGNPPFRFLVIGGSNLYSYGDGFYEVGTHNSSNYDKSLNWNTRSFWEGISNELIGKNFDVCFFDVNSFSQITNADVLGSILDIFTMFLKENGCIILKAYNIVRPNISTSTIERRFHNLVLETETMKTAESCEFMFDGDNNNVFRIFQKQGGELKIETKNIYPIDYDEKFKADKKSSTRQNPIEEKTMQEFLITRFGKKKCPYCSFINDESNVKCVVCDQNMNVPPPESKRQTQIISAHPESKRPTQVMEAHYTQGVGARPDGKHPLQGMTAYPEIKRPERAMTARARNGAAFAVCVDLSNPKIPRVLVCLLYVISDAICIENIKRLYDNERTTFGDVINELENIEDTRPILEHIDRKLNLRKVTENQKYMVNQNMRLIRYGGGLDIRETNLLMEYKFVQHPSEQLKAKIISQANIVLDTKIRPPTNEALRKQPTRSNVDWKKATFEYTINISSPNRIRDYASLMFNYWISSIESEELDFRSDIKFPLIGVFNACGCIKELLPDGIEPTRNALFEKMTPVEQHMHLEGKGFFANYNIGTDMAKIGISCEL